MERQQFENSTSGHLVPTVYDQWAFVPNPLPPGVDLKTLAGPIAAASHAVGELNGIGRLLPNPYLIIRPLQTQEALSSSRMEGTYSSLPELLLLEAGARISDQRSETREVANYVRALRDAIDSLGRIPLTLRLIKRAHERLLHGTSQIRGGRTWHGEFKTTQNWIGSSKDIRQARFVPPPPGDTLTCLDQFEKYIHRPNRNGTPAILDAALLHYQFETIHPFPDGNGRVGRILIPLILFERGTLTQPLLYVSPAIEARKDEYVDLMLAVSQQGDWTAWVQFFCEIVMDTCSRTVNVISLLQNLQTQHRNLLQQAGRSALLLQLSDMIFERPIVSIPAAQKRLEVTYRTAQKSIQKLVHYGILAEIPGTSHPKYYLSKQIMDAISSF